MSSDSDYVASSPQPGPSGLKGKKLRVALFGRSRKRSRSDSSDEQCTEEKRPRMAQRSNRRRKRRSESSESPVEKKRVREKKKCKVCGKFQLNIWRHMKEMHKEVHAEDSKESVKKIVSPHGYIVKRCPIPKCGKVVSRMREHLINTHKIPNGTNKLKNYLQRAQPVTDKAEVPTTRIKNETMNKEPEVVKIEISSSSSDDDGTSNLKLENASFQEKEHVINLIRCPIPKCGKVVSRMREHLINTHKIPNDTNKLKNYLQRAQPVTDKAEVPTTRIKNETMNKEPEVVKIEISSSSSDDDGTSNLKLENASFQEKEHVINLISSDEGETRCVTNIKQENRESSPNPNPESSDLESEPSLAAKSDSDHTEKEKETQGFDGYREVSNFLKWLKIRKFKTHENAVQHTQQALSIWKFMTPNLTLDGLLERKKLVEYVDMALVCKQPGTVISYLGSVNMLVQYLLDNDLFHDSRVPMALRFKDYCAALRRDLSPQVKKRRCVIETEEIETMIEPQDIQTFLSSEVAKECTDLLKRPQMPLAKPGFWNMRDFLLFRILQTNAQRSKAVRNISVDQISRAHRNEDGGVTIMVSDHKTAAQGPATLYLSPELVTMMKNFIESCRNLPGYGLESNKRIFFTWPNEENTSNLMPMTASLVNKAIQRIWNMGPVEKKLTITRLRKATATAVRKVSPESRLPLAKHMTHSAKTSDRYYILQNQRDNAQPIVNLIREVMEGPSKENEEDQDIPEVEDAHSKIEEAQIRIEQLKHGVKNIKESVHWPEDEMESSDSNTIEYSYEKNDIEENDSDDLFEDPPSPLVRNDVIETDEDASRHGRRTFTPEEANTLIRLCNVNITEGDLRKKGVMTTLQNTEEGLNLIEAIKAKPNTKGKDVGKILVDRLRTEAKKKKY